MGWSWPDLIVGAILLLGALKGYKRGFVMELAGALALAAGLITPWFYNGAFDGQVDATLHVGTWPAHVVAMVLVGIGAYIAVMLVARVIASVARLPVLGLGNALAGAAVGLLKAAIAIWIVLYVALFFPLSPGLRRELHRSVLVEYITAPNAAVDRAIISTLPTFARPFVRPIFARHQV